jgi:hypothetical protein
MGLKFQHFIILLFFGGFFRNTQHFRSGNWQKRAWNFRGQTFAKIPYLLHLLHSTLFPRLSL